MGGRQARRRVVVVGAGIGGLVAALVMAVAGAEVTVLEKAPRSGGKLRRVAVAGHAIESGPTVLTMRWVFEAIFATAGARLDAHLRLTPASVLARHFWDDGSVMDLHADEDASAAAVAALAGPNEEEGYRAFRRLTAEVFGTLEAGFVEHPAPNIATLTRSVGLGGLARLSRIEPFNALAKVVGRHFRDPRLRQLFGRYATYCGSSPYLAPGPLMLIAHVEQRGVWLVEGGLTRIAEALERIGREWGIEFRHGAEVAAIEAPRGTATGVRLGSGERIAADAVVFNGDPAALAAGLLGSDVSRAVPGVAPGHRSLSALTWSMRGDVQGFPLSHHNVFFSKDYPAEFRDLFARNRLPEDPTVYVCAQDRDARATATVRGEESLFLLVNAPARSDTHPFSQEEIAACETRMVVRLARAGLRISGRREASVRTEPGDFAAMFPGSSGALYGRASHGWAASFRRPGAKTRIKGLFLAGGGTHPGAGVPMAALSGRHAASAVLTHLASTARSRPAAMPGGISMRSATTGGTR
ncbi:1-hydroxycarotenoid 3,4-desaturase CrtD [Aureimonas leprariae]|uniref:Phytoene desaturase n=1 Tax=Plantimonas leprariae TaxID=2615207 RepID=A0A7V7PQC8_9HYPH|nr:1-hydroxycarotenoid 3,4-desaturase CrtD [Aureimonas leprariae]KAB0680314.1 phytoene desaturase [Aureimonas leprariae]